MNIVLSVSRDRNKLFKKNSDRKSGLRNLAKSFFRPPSFISIFQMKLFLQEQPNVF